MGLLLLLAAYNSATQILDVNHAVNVGELQAVLRKNQSGCCMALYTDRLFVIGGEFQDPPENATSGRIHGDIVIIE
jgi:hypothetical protein